MGEGVAPSIQHFTTVAKPNEIQTDADWVCFPFKPDEFKGVFIFFYKKNDNQNHQLHRYPAVDPGVKRGTSKGEGTFLSLSPPPHLLSSATSRQAGDGAQQSGHLAIRSSLLTQRGSPWPSSASTSTSCSSSRHSSDPSSRARQHRIGARQVAASARRPERGANLPLPPPPPAPGES
jgi:hypothetical protein